MEREISRNVEKWKEKCLHVHFFSQRFSFFSLSLFLVSLSILSRLQRNDARCKRLVPEPKNWINFSMHHLFVSGNFRLTILLWIPIPSQNPKLNMNCLPDYLGARLNWRQISNCFVQVHSLWVCHALIGVPRAEEECQANSCVTAVRTSIALKAQKDLAKKTKSLEDSERIYSQKMKVCANCKETI